MEGRQKSQDKKLQSSTVDSVRDPLEKVTEHDLE
jgi:hypothetical protein